MKSLRPFFFSLTQNQRHIIRGKVWDKNSLLEVLAETEQQAIDKVFSMVGYQWGNVYDKEEKEFFPDGVCVTVTA